MGDARHAGATQAGHSRFAYGQDRGLNEVARDRKAKLGIHVIGSFEIVRAGKFPSGTATGIMARMTASPR
jgi:hypothetical protein